MEPLMGCISCIMPTVTYKIYLNLNDEVASFQCWMQDQMISDGASVCERQNMTVLHKQ